MKKLNLHEMYMLGKRLAPLAELKAEALLRPHLFHLWWARVALQENSQGASPLLEASRRAALAVVSAINDFLPTDLEEAFKLDDKKTVGYDGVWAKQRLEEFESVLANEMPGCPAYIVSQTGIYRTEGLIDHAEEHFPYDVLSNLPNQTMLDLREAGKALAFQLPTACSFHLWRAVETVTDDYYEALTGKSFEDDGVSRNWGAKIKALVAKQADGRVTAFLDHIREQYRNPHTHPDVMVELDEAQMLFGAATSSIAQIVAAIKKTRQAGSSGALALVQQPQTLAQTP